MIEWLTANTGWLIPTAVIAIGGIVVYNGARKVVRRIKRKVNSVLGGFDSIIDIAKAGEIEAKGPKSVGGNTQMYMSNISKDFPDFHSPDAEAAIRTFLIEYLKVKYGGQEDFEKSKVNENILLNIDREIAKTVDDIKINNIAIYKYVKAKDYATITYRVSAGFDLNNERTETRYEIWYTLQLSKNNMPTAHMSCRNCGGTFDSTKDKVCPYCGSEVIKDTIMNWFVTKIVEV